MPNFDEKIHFNLLIVVYLNDAGQFLLENSKRLFLDSISTTQANHLHEMRVHGEKSGCSQTAWR